MLLVAAGLARRNAAVRGAAGEGVDHVARRRRAAAELQHRRDAVSDTVAGAVIAAAYARRALVGRRAGAAVGDLGRAVAGGAIIGAQASGVAAGAAVGIARGHVGADQVRRAAR